MHPASSYMPKPDQVLLIDAQTSCQKITEFLKKNKSGEKLCLFTTRNNQLYLAVDTLQNREVFLHSSRKLVKSTLKNLQSDTLENKFLTDIRANLQRDTKDSQILQIGREQLQSLLTGSSDRFNDYGENLSPKKAKSILASIKPQIKSVLKKPPVNLQGSALKTLGIQWAAVAMDEFRAGHEKTSKEQLRQFKLTMQAKADADLMAEFIEYCNDHLEHSLDSTDLKQVAECVVDVYKQELSTAEYDTDTAAIRIGKQVLTPIGERHKGGFGEVQVYADKKHPEHTLAAKFAISVKDSSVITHAQGELHNHLRAMGNGHVNVMSLRGAIRTEKELILLMEDCSKGTLESFGQKLSSAAQSGTITPDIAARIRLTLALDLLRGLAHLHDEVNMTHSDFKPQNVFIGVDGYGKVGDFDLAAPGASHRMLKSKVPATAQYLAPELIADLNAANADLQRFNAQVPAPGIKERSAFRKSQTVNMSKSVDAFAAGATLYELFYGVNPFVRRMSQIDGLISFADYEDLMDRYASKSPAGRMEFLFDDATLLPGLESHEEELRKLIFLLMAPDREYRSTAAAVLQRPIFSLPGLDTPEIRDLIRTL